MSYGNPTPLYYWHLVTRLGEAQTVLPLALVAALVLLRRSETRALAAWWMALLSAAVLLTTASKLAFIGWGLGWPEFNFTGISGHAMFASAVYPLLLGTLLVGRGPRAAQPLAFAAGCALALLIGVSRVEVGAHSVSEVVAGLLVGGLVSATVLAMVRLPRVLIGPVIPVAVALFALLMPAHAPASASHAAVVRLSLLLSGRVMPYTRADMLRKVQPGQSVLCDPSRCLGSPSLAKASVVFTPVPADGLVWAGAAGLPAVRQR